MAIDAADVSVNASGDIRWAGGGTGSTYTVLELHRFLQDLADNAQASGDDLVDITTFTPSERSTDNIITLLDHTALSGPTFNIDATMSQHLYDGSITQDGGDTQYSGLRVLGAVNDTGTTLQIVQNNALVSPVFWGSQQYGGFNGDAQAGILMRCMILTRSGGTNIDGKRARVQARQWGDTYDFFNVTLGQGESVAAIGTTPDAQNNTAISTVSGYTNVTNAEGYQLIDLNNSFGPRPYYSQWTFGADDQGDGLKSIWEWGKYITTNGTVDTIHGINGELFLGITHEYNFGSETGTAFVENDIIYWTGSTTGTALLLALNDSGSTGVVWFQLLTGVAPTNGEVIWNQAQSGSHTLTAPPTSRTVPKVFLGSYTGSLIGAFGIGVDKDDVGASDSLFDLLGGTQIPPNNVTFTLSGLVAAQDRVLIGPKDTGNAFKFDQLTLDTTLAAASTAIVVTTAIPSDTPSSGTTRVLDDNGVYVRSVYSAWTTSTFSLVGTFGSDATAPKNVFISYIDLLATAGSETFTAIYSSPRSLWIRVRDGGITPIKTYESQGTLGSAGGSAVASRISDL